MQRNTRSTKQFRQGDVLLIAVAGVLAASLKPAERDQGRIVLAYGEVTGHAHAITEERVVLLVADDAAAMGDAARELLASVGLTTEIRDEDIVGVLTVGEDAVVRHEEHAPIPLVAGEQFLVLRQREYSPERIVQVAD